MNKKVFFLIAWCCFFWGSTSNANIITLGYVDFPPYEFEEQGKPSGVLVEIVESLFKQANTSLDLKFLPFKRAFKETQNGRINGLFNLYKTKERLNYFDYTEPIIVNPLVFFVRKDSKIKFESLVDLRGLKVGTMLGYTYGADFDKSTLFTKETSISHAGNLKKLLIGRIDLYPCDQLVCAHVAMKHKLNGKFKILSTPLKVMNGHIGFTKGKHKAIINKINNALAQMRKNGSVEKMIRKYTERNK